jgi:hypothetical protein
MTAPDRIQITHQPRTMTTPDIRAALDTFQQAANRGTAVYLSPELVQELRAALKAEPEGEGPSVEQMYYWALKSIYKYGSDTLSEQADDREWLRAAVAEMVRRAQESLDYGTPIAPPAPPALYIDPEGEDADKQLLEVFYRQMGRGLEVHPAALLRGIRGVRAFQFAPATPPAPEVDPSHIDQLAAIIRKVDGNNSMGAAALAEAILERYSLAFLVDPPAAAPAPGENLATPPAPEPETPPNDAWWHELINEIARVQHVAAGEGQGGRFDLAKAVELWCRPATPPAPEPGEVGELVEFLTPTREQAGAISLEAFTKLRRAATLLQQQEAELAALRGVPVAWCLSDEFENAMKRGGSFNGWKDPGAGANKCDMRLYAIPLPAPQAGEVEA